MNQSNDIAAFNHLESMSACLAKDLCNIGEFVRSRR
jgi:hypothetical protein